MSKSRLEWKVGLFVILCLGLLAALVIEFSKGTSPWKKTYTLKLQAGNVGGLKPRAGVLMAGVQIGSVSAIQLSPQGTNVTLALTIDSNYLIPTNSDFSIEQSGFSGTSMCRLPRGPARIPSSPICGTAMRWSRRPRGPCLAWRTGS